MSARATCHRCGAPAVPTTLTCLSHVNSTHEDYEMEFAVDTILRAEYASALMDDARREGLRQTLGRASSAYDPFDFEERAHSIAFGIALG